MSAQSARQSAPQSATLLPPSPQELVERALAASRSDDCIVIADEGSTANLRWAGNSLTTNGVSRSRQLTVIAFSRGGDETRVGVVSRAGVRADQVAEIVAEAENAAAEAFSGRGRTAARHAVGRHGRRGEPVGRAAQRYSDWGVRRLRR